MPKHKKTRAEKLKADERHANQTVAQHMHTTPVYSFSSSMQQTQHKPIAVVGNTIAHVEKDLRKTALVSLLIVFLQLILFILLKNHVLAISFARY